MNKAPVTIVGVLRHADGSIEHVTLTGFALGEGPSHPVMPPPDSPGAPSHPVGPPPGPDQQSV